MTAKATGTTKRKGGKGGTKAPTKTVNTAAVKAKQAASAKAKQAPAATTGPGTGAKSRAAAKGASAKATTAKAATTKAAAKPAPKVKDEPPPKPVFNENSRDGKAMLTDLQVATQNLLKGIRTESKNSAGANAARWAKGMHISNLEGIAERLKAAGHEDFQARGAGRLYARNAYLASMQPGDTGSNKLSAAEMSDVVTAYETYARHHGDMDATFVDVDAWDRGQGAPLLNDAGEPFTRSVTSIPINKAKAVKDLYTESNRDKLLSFVFNNTEKVVKSFAKLADEDTLIDLIDAINGAQRDVDLEAEEVLTAEEVALAEIKQQQGEAPTPTTKSIKVDAAWFDGDFKRTKDEVTAVYKRFDLPLDDKGQVPNTVLLERLFAFFVSREHGIEPILNALLAAEDITRRQAKAFLAEWTNAQEGATAGDEEDEAAEGVEDDDTETEDAEGVEEGAEDTDDTEDGEADGDEAESDEDDDGEDDGEGEDDDDDADADDDEGGDHWADDEDEDEDES